MIASTIAAGLLFVLSVAVMGLAVYDILRRGGPLIPPDERSKPIIKFITRLFWPIVIAFLLLLIFLVIGV